MTDPSTRGGARVVRAPSRFRLAMTPSRRSARVAVLAVIGVLFLAFATGEGVEPWWRVFGVAGVVVVVAAVRIVVGPAVVVGHDGLRIMRSWPMRRDIPWYRILEVEVVPVTWVLHIELNSGEHLELPSVEHLDRLYREIEARRHELDG